MIRKEHIGLVKLGSGSSLVAIGFLLIFVNSANIDRAEFVLPFSLAVIIIAIGIATIAHAGIYDTRIQHTSPTYPAIRDWVIERTIDRNYAGSEKARLERQQERRRRTNEVMVLWSVAGLFMVIFPVVLLARNVPVNQLLLYLRSFAVSTCICLGLVYGLTHVFLRGGRRAVYSHKLKDKP